MAEALPINLMLSAHCEDSARAQRRGDLRKCNAPGRRTGHPRGEGLAFGRDMRWKTDLRERAFQFGLAVLKLHRRVAASGAEYAPIALQLTRAATSIGAQLEEGQVAKSRADMALKYAIALREARESRYWLRTLIAADVQIADLQSLYQEAHELVAMLTVSVTKLRSDRANASG